MLLFFGLLAIANVAVFLIQAFWITPMQVPGISMSPALEPGDRVLVRRTSLQELDRGDLVVFAVRKDAASKRLSGNKAFGTPRSDDVRLVVKRVIGLPSEHIEANRGVIAIDETNALKQPWLPSEDSSTIIEGQYLDRNEIFVLGDFRDRSHDSRHHGPVPESAILGRVVFRYWPFDRAGRID